MFIFENRVFIFHNDKYWVYELNAGNSDKPLGPLIEGNMNIEYKWEGIIGLKTEFAIYYNRIIAITGHKWTELEIDGSISNTGSIYDKESDVGGTDVSIVQFLVWF